MTIGDIYVSRRVRKHPAAGQGVPILAVLVLLMVLCWTGCVSGKTEPVETVAAESAVAAAATSVTAPAADPFTRGYPLVQLQEDFRELQKYIES
ncbi:MAG: hypothetical protein KKI09_06755, partial [Spirochaetes bacterium]|nr:hypothetical protein [Spirochaetota bacterium]MBU0955109.1 hypothetical protein [Spirochaetota bacterium]